MSENPYDLDSMLDRAASQIASSQPDAEVAKAAATRVWNRLTADSADAAAQAAEVEEIRGCDDYQTLIPAYLAQALPEARKLLLEDHTRECVPCRRALVTAREGEAPPKPWKQAETKAPSWQAYRKWALAAALIAGIGLAQLVVREMMPFGSGTSATVQTVDGDLFRIAATSHLPMAEGDAIEEGETVRTGRTGSAVVRLRDGSLIEINERSELRIEEGRRGTTLELERGSVIVQAAEQRPRHLYVATEDCLVSVTGTIFSVNHGTKGSRVSVIEGEVRVAHSGEETVLRPGQQVATHATLAAVPVSEDIAWSRDVDRYLSLLEEYTQLRRELQEAVPRPGLRYASRLLDLAPESTVFYAALPNLSDTIRETHRVIQERIDDSQVLAEWWHSQGAEQFAPDVDEIVGRLSAFGDFLGEEVAVCGYSSGPGDFDGPLVLAEVVDPAGLRDFIERQVEELSHGEGHDELVFVDDPFTIQAGEGRLFLWLSDGLAVASPDAAEIERVAGIVLRGASNPFTETDFHAAIAKLYREGTEILVAADLEGVVRTTMEGESESDVAQFARLGFADVRHLLLEQKQLGPKTHHRASLTFKEARRGLASWLASPAPMGALDFVSPDAQLVGAFVFKDPVKLLDDLYGLASEEGDLGSLSDFEKRHGFSVRDDLAASLGGEIAFALDGPLLPQPSWKVILEVYDPARLQWAIEEGLAELNTHLQQEGHEPVELLRHNAGGRTYYSIGSEIAVHYTYAEGYMLVGANRTLLDRAIRFRDSGYTITDASRFKSLLPADGRNNFSGLIYQDLSGVMQSVAERLAEGRLSEEQQLSLDAMRAESAPMLGYAYGDESSILVAASSDNDALSSVMLYLLGMKNPAGIEQLLQGL